MIVPFAAGGTSDVIARIVADRMGAILGQRIVNENVAGAGGANAMTRLARAEPDGYTIAIGNAGTNAATYTIYPDLKFKPDAFEPVGIVAKTVGALAVRKDFPAADLAEFVAFAKKNPGKVTLGHAGIGSSNYLICRIFMQSAGVEVERSRAVNPDLDGCDLVHVFAASPSEHALRQFIHARRWGKAVVLSPEGWEAVREAAEAPERYERGLRDLLARGAERVVVPDGTAQIGLRGYAVTEVPHIEDPAFGAAMARVYGAARQEFSAMVERDGEGGRWVPTLSAEEMQSFKHEAFLAILDEEEARLKADPGLVRGIRAEVMGG